jgi:predicted GNAT family N-acyltransferase
MSTHDPNGQYLVIHSVTVDSRHRRRALGKTMLRDYVNYISAHRPEIAGINLLSKAYLLSFYQSVGFSIVGPSHVQHGKVSFRRDLFNRVGLN